MTSCRHALSQPYLPTNDGCLAGGNAPQDRGTRITHPVILHDRMARLPLDQDAVLAFCEPLGAKSHRLIETDTLSNDAGFTDDDTGPVIDKEVTADVGSRVNIDACG